MCSTYKVLRRAVRDADVNSNNVQHINSNNVVNSNISNTYIRHMIDSEHRRVTEENERIASFDEKMQAIANEKARVKEAENRLTLHDEFTSLYATKILAQECPLDVLIQQEKSQALAKARAVTNLRNRKNTGLNSHVEKFKFYYQLDNEVSKRRIKRDQIKRNKRLIALTARLIKNRKIAEALASAKAATAIAKAEYRLRAQEFPEARRLSNERDKLYKKYPDPESRAAAIAHDRLAALAHDRLVIKHANLNAEFHKQCAPNILALEALREALAIYLKLVAAEVRTRLQLVAAETHQQEHVASEARIINEAQVASEARERAWISVIARERERAVAERQYCEYKATCTRARTQTNQRDVDSIEGPNYPPCPNQDEVEAAIEKIYREIDEDEEREQQQALDQQQQANWQPQELDQHQAYWQQRQSYWQHQYQEPVRDEKYGESEINILQDMLRELQKE